MDFRESHLSPLILNNSSMCTVAPFKLLGTAVTQDLKLEMHLSSFSKKAQQIMHFLQHLSKSHPPQAILVQFHTAPMEIPPYVCHHYLDWCNLLRRKEEAAAHNQVCSESPAAILSLLKDLRHGGV